MKIIKSYIQQVRKLFNIHEETSCDVLHDLKTSSIFLVVLWEVSLQTKVYICCNGKKNFGRIQEELFLSFSEIISIRDS